jgi:hypothetical protein
MNHKTSTLSDSTSDRHTTLPGGAAEETKDLAAKALQSTVTEGAREVGFEVRYLAGDVAHEAKRAARTQIDATKERAADGLGTVATALRQTSRNLAEQDEIGVTGLIDQAASRVDGLSDYLRERSLSGIVSDVESFARREPALFLGGAFVAGLIGGRFLKSSRPSKLDPHLDIRDGEEREARRASESDRDREPSDRRDTQREPSLRETRRDRPATSMGATSEARVPSPADVQANAKRQGNEQRVAQPTKDNDEGQLEITALPAVPHTQNRETRGANGIGGSQNGGSGSKIEREAGIDGAKKSPGGW